MLSSIDVYSNVAVYIQIENHIQFAIASGKLVAEERLPSVRELSERLGVNPNTVAKAYRDLEVMGLLFTRRGMGVYIKRGIQEQCRQECRKRIVARLYEIASESKAAGMQRKNLMEVLDKSMSIDGSPYADTPPAILAMAKKMRSK